MFKEGWRLEIKIWPMRIRNPTMIWENVDNQRQDAPGQPWQSGGGASQPFPARFLELAAFQIIMSEQSLQGSHWVGFNNCLVWGWLAPKWAWKSSLWCFSNVFDYGLTKCSFFRCAWFSQQDVGHCGDEPSSVALPGNDFLHLIKHCARMIIKHNSCSCSCWLLADS